MANIGIAPPNYDTPVGQVRLLIQDTDASNISAGSGEYLWQSDDDIAAMIKARGSAQRAAIYILRMVAMTPSMQLKKWSSADLTVDGPAITRALREMIKDIEDGLNEEAGVTAAEVAMIVPTGAAISQPALYPGAQGVDLDPTLPIRMV